MALRAGDYRGGKRSSGYELLSFQVEFQETAKE